MMVAGFIAPSYGLFAEGRSLSKEVVSSGKSTLPIEAKLFETCRCSTPLRDIMHLEPTRFMGC